MGLAQIGADAEQWFGTNGGIMDQYVITHGRAGHALLIDCRALTHRVVPIPDSARIVVAHTGTARRQITSPFADRRREAESGLHVLQRAIPSIRTLRDVSPDTFSEHRMELMKTDPSGAVWRRCRHVVTEMGRVGEAATAIGTGDLVRAGALMQQAHASLRDDYEVSSPEIEAMFEAAAGLPGWYGARMTGGGFGGCTVNLVAADSAQAFCARLADAYEQKTNITPEIFATTACDGLSTYSLA
jgi:galactokinase